MRDIIDRQIFVISVNMFNFNTSGVSSQVNLPMNLRFSAKHISYNSAIPPNQAIADINDVGQIWCNITNDNLIGSFTNNGANLIPVNVTLDNHFSLSNSGFPEIEPTPVMLFVPIASAPDIVSPAFKTRSC